MIVPQTYEPFGCLVALHGMKQAATAAGLVFPDGSSAEGGVAGVREADMAVVVAVGPKCEQYKPGDVVFFAQQVLLQQVVVGGVLTLLAREDHLGGRVLPDYIPDFIKKEMGKKLLKSEVK